MSDSMDGKKSDSDRYVCAVCIGDEVLKTEITSIDRTRVCTYCGKRNPAVSIESLAERVDDVYLNFVRIGDQVPDFDDESDNVHWRVNGSQPSELVQQMTDCDVQKIAKDVVEILHEGEARAVYKDSARAMYAGLDDVYEIPIPEDGEYRGIWQSFQRSIKHRNRFSNDRTLKRLSEILGPIVSCAWPPNSKAVKVLKADGPEKFIYRGRLANDRASQTVIH